MDAVRGVLFWCAAVLALTLAPSCGGVVGGVDGGGAAGGGLGGGAGGGVGVGGGTGGGHCVPGLSGGGGLVTFDTLADHADVADQYLAMGVRFSTPVGLPVVYGMFGSPVSAPNFLLGQYEGVDLNPGLEFGDNLPAVSIVLTFVDPVDGRQAAVTHSVSLREVYSNQDDVTQADGYDLSGALVTSMSVVGDAAMRGKGISLAHAAGLHRVVVSFGAAGSTGVFEDTAGIDDVSFAPVTYGCP